MTNKIPRAPQRGDAFQSLLWSNERETDDPRPSQYSATIRISDAHPDVLQEFVFSDRLSRNQIILGTGIGLAKPNRRAKDAAYTLKVRLSHDFAARAQATLGGFGIADRTPPGVAVLLTDQVHLAPPVYSEMMTFATALYPQQRRFEPFGILRANIRGAHVIQTDVDRRHGTYSVQFWESVPPRPTRAAPNVHLIFGLDYDDADAWRRSLCEGIAERQELPEWAKTRGTLESCHVPMMWRVIACVASFAMAIAFAGSLFRGAPKDIVRAILMPPAIYAAWRCVHLFPLSRSRQWYARVLRSAQVDCARMSTSSL